MTIHTNHCLKLTLINITNSLIKPMIQGHHRPLLFINEKKGDDRLLISIKEFAAIRNVSVQSVYQQIQRHPELHVHIRTKNGKKHLDSYAQYILSGNPTTKVTELDSNVKTYELIHIIETQKSQIKHYELENQKLQNQIKKYKQLAEQLYQI